MFKLLYASALPDNLSRENFEIYFGDILSGGDFSRNLSNFIKENNIPKTLLSSIEKYAQSDNIYKFPHKVYIKLAGDVNPHNLVFCKVAIEALNKVSPNLHLQLADASVWHDLPSITITYDSLSKYGSPTAERVTEMGTMAYGRRVKGAIQLHYDASSVDWIDVDRLQCQSMYKILGFDNLHEEAFQFEAGKLVLKEKYKQLLKLLYDNNFPDGITKRALQDAIADIK